MIKESLKRWIPVVIVAASACVSVRANDVKHEITSKSLNAARDAFYDSQGIRPMASQGMIRRRRSESGQYIFHYEPPENPIAESVGGLLFNGAIANADEKYREVINESAPFLLGTEVTVYQAGKISFVAGGTMGASFFVSMVREVGLGKGKKKRDDTSTPQNMGYGI